MVPLVIIQRYDRTLTNVDTITRSQELFPKDRYTHGADTHACAFNPLYVMAVEDAGPTCTLISLADGARIHEILTPERFADIVARIDAALKV